MRYHKKLLSMLLVLVMLPALSINTFAQSFIGDNVYPGLSLYDYCMLNNRIDLLQQWDADANLPLTPETVTSGSSRKVWWF